MAQNVVEYALKVNTGKAEQGLKNVSNEAGKASGQIKSLGQSGAKDLQNLSEETTEAGKSFQGLSKEAGQLGRGTQQLSRAVSMVSPEMGAAMNATAGMAMAVKGLGTVINTLNPAILAIGAAVAVAAAAYAYFSGESDKASEAADELREKQEALTESAEKGAQAYEKYGKAMDALDRRNQKTADGITNLKAEIAILQGEIEGADLKELKMAQDVAKFEAQLVDSKQKELALTEATAGAVQAQVYALENQIGALNKTQQSKLDGLKSEKEALRIKQRNLRLQLDIYDGSQDTVQSGDALAGTLQVQSTWFNKNKAFAYETASGIERGVGATERVNDEIRTQVSLYEALIKLKNWLLGEEKKEKRSSGGGSWRSKRDAKRRDDEKIILELIKSQVKEFERMATLSSDLSDSISRAQKELTNQDISLNDLRAERLKIQAQSLSGEEKELALLKASKIIEEGKAERLKIQTTEIDNKILSLREENELTKLALVDAERMLQLAKKQAGAKKWQEKSQKAVLEAQSKVIDAQINAGEIELKTQKQINQLIAKKGQIQKRNQLNQLIDQEKVNASATKGIQKIIGQLDKMEETKPLDQMNQQLDDFDKKMQVIGDKLAEIRETKPFDNALHDLNVLEGRIPKLREKLKDKLELELEFKKIDDVGREIIQAFETISSPAGFTKSLATNIGKQIGSFIGSKKGMGSNIGGVVGNVISAVAELGKKTPAEIKSEMMAFADAFAQGLKILPTVLIKVLPEFALAIAKGIIFAIPVLIGEIAKMISNFISSIFGNDEEEPFTQKEQKKSSLFSGPLIGSDLQTVPPEGRAGLRFTSGTFGGAGLAVLHPNEYVVPSTGQRPQAIDRQLQNMNGSGGMNITINSMMTEYSAVDSLVNKIEQRFKTFGGATSTLFTG